MSELDEKFPNSAYQRGVLTPQLIEKVDSPEYRHYLYTVSNPALKYILDSKMQERHEKQGNNQLLENIISLDQKFSLPRLFEYLVLTKEGNDLIEESKKLENENNNLKRKIQQLKESMEQK